MARVNIVKPESVDDPAIEGIFAWVTEMEGAVPNHFYVEMNFPEFFPAKLGATKVLWEAGELSMEEIQH
ncbi:MAG: carboxymuconolactone decarboxylase family protein, partial [Halioglobus sp.]